jgi:hypothetical protein
MRRWLLRSVGGLLTGMAIAAAAVAASNVRGPTTEVLRQDLIEVEAEIKEAQTAVAQYGSGSLIAAEIQLRVAILQTTKSMLEQKERSWLRGIDLSYVVDGRKLSPDPALISRLQKDLATAEAEAAAAREKASLYSGGLVQAMALAEEQTHLVTRAAIRQNIALAGIGLTFPAAAAAESQPAPIGQTVDEEGAL